MILGRSASLHKYFFMQSIADLMKGVINKVTFGRNEDSPFIFDMIPAALSNVPFHNDTREINRYFSPDFPFHLAVHEVSPVVSPPKEYTQVHSHTDSAEINIILSRHLLVYRIQLGRRLYTVSSNSSIYIPAGILHSANVLKGSGFFVTMRMPALPQV
jgi:hypothetical protein